MIRKHNAVSSLCFVFVVALFVVLRDRVFPIIANSLGASREFSLRYLIDRGREQGSRIAFCLVNLSTLTRSTSCARTSSAAGSIFDRLQTLPNKHSLQAAINNALVKPEGAVEKGQRSQKLSLSSGCNSGS